MALLLPTYGAWKQEVWRKESFALHSVTYLDREQNGSSPSATAQLINAPSGHLGIGSLELNKISFTDCRDVAASQIVYRLPCHMYIVRAMQLGELRHSQTLAYCSDLCVAKFGWGFFFCRVASDAQLFWDQNSVSQRVVILQWVTPSLPLHSQFMFIWAKDQFLLSSTVHEWTIVWCQPFLSRSHALLWSQSKINFILAASPATVYRADLEI